MDSSLSGTAAPSAFQSFPVCNTILRAKHLAQVSQTSGSIATNTYPRSIRANRPIACLRSDNSASERSEQRKALEEQPGPTFPLSSEFVFVLTLVATAAAGGPVLAAWGVFFLILGKATGTPHWLQAFSTFLFASITDALTYNWTTVSLDSGYTPFLVFLLASGTAVVYEASSLFPSLDSAPREGTVILSESQETKEPRHQSNQTTSDDGKQFVNWDHAFREAHKNEDPDY